MRTTSINRQYWLWFLVAIIMVSMVAPDFGFGRRGKKAVLVANFMNGRNDVIEGRIYLFNASNKAGRVTVRVFTLPVSGGLREELTTTPLDLGSLGAKEAVNIRLDIDILAFVSGVMLPHTKEGGNVALEFRVGAKDVTGLAQNFIGTTLANLASYTHSR